MIVDRPGDGHRAGGEIRLGTVERGGIAEDHAHRVAVGAGTLASGKSDGDVTRGAGGECGDISDTQIGRAT